MGNIVPSVILNLIQYGGTGVLFIQVFCCGLFTFQAVLTRKYFTWFIWDIFVGKVFRNFAECYGRKWLKLLALRFACSLEKFGIHTKLSYVLRDLAAWHQLTSWMLLSGRFCSRSGYDPSSVPFAISVFSTKASSSLK